MINSLNFTPKFFIMKKVFAAMLLSAAIFISGSRAYAQQTPAAKDSAKAAKKAAKAKAALTTKTTTTPAPPPATSTTKPAAKTVQQGVNKSSDKAVGTDAKGRTIYEGPKGGRYVITAAGNKEYIKKTN
jgi:hypothetical protein